MKGWGQGCCPKAEAWCVWLSLSWAWLSWPWQSISTKGGMELVEGRHLGSPLHSGHWHGAALAGCAQSLVQHKLPGCPVLLCPLGMLATASQGRSLRSRIVQEDVYTKAVVPAPVAGQSM